MFGGRLPAECGIANARRIVECSGRRKLGCTSTRWAERQRIVGVARIVEQRQTRLRRAQALPFRRHKGHSSPRLPIKALSLGGYKGGYSLSAEREYPPWCCGAHAAFSLRATRGKQLEQAMQLLDRAFDIFPPRSARKATAPPRERKKEAALSGCHFFTFHK